MLLGNLIAQLDDGATAAATLDALGDIVLVARLAEAAAHHGETPGEYAATAVRRFAAHADHEAWVGLVGAMGRAEDPGRIALERMVRWALADDVTEADPSAQPATRCSCHAEPGEPRRGGA